MAHFAKVNSEDNTILSIIVVHNNELLDENEEEQESLGIAFLESHYGTPSGYYWKQTSYNNNFRKRLAFPDHGDGLGPGTYDPVNDVFIDPKPYPSWILDSDYAWEAPITRPTVETYTDIPDENRPDGTFRYWIFWDEDAYQADNTKGWKARDAAGVAFEWNTSTLAWDAE